MVWSPSRVPHCPAAALLPRRWVRVFDGQLLEQASPAAPAAPLDALEPRIAVLTGDPGDEDLEEIVDEDWALLGHEAEP